MLALSRERAEGGCDSSGVTLVRPPAPFRAPRSTRRPTPSPKDVCRLPRPSLTGRRPSS